LEAGFAEFYQASYRRLATHVYAYVGSAAEAEDDGITISHSGQSLAGEYLGTD
jgi:hypothetical protein